MRHSDMMIKVCGLRDTDNIARVASMTPMLMGFIFHPASPRHAGALDPEVVKALPPFVRPVAVTVDMDPDSVIELCNRYGIRIVQLHGSESPGDCRRLRRSGLTVFKALGAGTSTDLDTLAAPYVEREGTVDMLLFDCGTAGHGGTGRKFDWTLLDTYTGAVPFMLSGGIGPGDADAVIAAMRPGMAGVDINSRFEKEPGVKDTAALLHFILNLRKHNEDDSTPTPFWEKTI